MFPILNPPLTSLPVPSLWVVQGTSPKYPVLCIKTGLVICFIYDIIHVSMTFSQIIPSSHSPTESKTLFYTSVSLLLSCIQGYCYIFLNSIYMRCILYWCFSFWLTSLCIIGSSFIHLIRMDSNVFFLMAELCICTTALLSIHLLVDI